MTGAYLGLGGNVGDVVSNFRRALDAFVHRGWGVVTAVSPLYRSAPLGPGRQDDYLNAVARLEPTLEPAPLLAALKSLETAAGRAGNGPRWGPRPLDLDLLVYNGHACSGATLELPHPRIAERNFVLLPLADVAGGRFRIPGQGMLTELIADCPANRIERCGDQSWYGPAVTAD